MSNFLLRATLTLPAASRLFRALTVGAAILSTTTVLADTEYYRHTFFDNSITSDSYYYSSGKAVVPSILKLRDGKLPVDSSTFVTPPNSLRLAWQSLAGGSWQAEITVVDFRNREVLFRGDTLSFWCYSAEALPAAKLPQLRFLDAHHNFSAPLRIVSASKRTLSINLILIAWKDLSSAKESPTAPNTRSCSMNSG
ncbi:MAG: hypothetical protein DMG28_05175 [Acidobacteria bacterium]|nr:MAG: hypothetical protein DMG28_05175 [Acidobacteriota bacterium]